MAKGSKQPGKKESKPVVKEDAEVAVKEEFAVSVDEGKGIIDFYYLFCRTRNPDNDHIHHHWDSPVPSHSLIFFFLNPQ